MVGLLEGIERFEGFLPSHLADRAPPGPAQFNAM
jgi:hypothetical protein